MKSPYVVALIKRDAVEHLPVVVPAHEVPVLAAVHGESRVHVKEDADLPNGVTEATVGDLRDEFARLENRYGNHPKTGTSFAAMAFGGFNGFVQTMQAGEEEGEDAPRRGRKPKVEG